MNITQVRGAINRQTDRDAIHDTYSLSDMPTYESCKLFVAVVTCHFRLKLNREVQWKIFLISRTSEINRDILSQLFNFSILICAADTASTHC